MNIKQMTKMSICVALLCVSAYISFPLPFLPIMITAQTMVINIIALILNPKQAAITVLVYMLIGAVGVPVFSGGMAGIGRILGPTGGFMLGFIIAAPLMSFLKGKTNSFIRYIIVTIFIGMPVIYLFGTIQLSIVNEISFIAALSGAVIPFIIGDILKCIAAAYLAVVLNKVLAKMSVA